MTTDIAIIGLGKVGEYLANLLAKSICTGELTEINKIYCIGRNEKSVSARISDVLHAEKLEQYFAKNNFTQKHFHQFISTSDYSNLKHTKYIITCFGNTKTKISDRTELLLPNTLSAISIAKQIKQYAPKDVVVINIANPVEVITWHLQECCYLPSNQVIGIAGAVDVVRLAQAIHDVIGIDYDDIDYSTLFVFGEHGEGMVPILSQVKIYREINGERKNVRLLDIIDSEDKKIKLIQYLKNIGIKILQDSGIAAHLAPATAIFLTLFNMIKGIENPTCCCVWDDIYQCYITRLVKFINNKPVILPLSMNSEEKTSLFQSVRKIQDTKANILNLLNKQQTGAPYFFKAIFNNFVASKSDVNLKDIFQARL